MTLHQWFGIFAGMLLLAFLVFAFRQGQKVKPSGREDRDSIAGESSYGGGDSGHH
jgi:cbb3-type cytochrome oxidase subunit 3